MPSRPPHLYRWTRLVRRISTVFLIVLVLFLGTVGYSAAQIHPSIAPPTKATSVLASNGTVLLLSLVNVSNPGFYPLSQVQLTVNLILPSGITFLRGGSAPSNVAAGQTATIPLDLFIPLNSLGQARSLLTNDTALTADTWFNATYALVFPFQGFVPSNFTWGAPFNGLGESLTPPVPQSNGTTVVTVNVHFQNHAPFADNGALTFALLSATGVSCAKGKVSVYVPAGASYNQGTSVFVPNSCMLAGGSLVPSYSGLGFNLTLPSEGIP